MRPAAATEDAEVIAGGCPECGNDAALDQDPESHRLHCLTEGCPGYDPAGEQQLWFEVNDVAELTFDTGETIVGLWTRPRGTHAGWVLTDGTRLRARPRTLVHIRIVYPPDRIAEESVTHDDHTTEPAPDA